MNSDSGEMERSNQLLITFGQKSSNELSVACFSHRVYNLLRYLNVYLVINFPWDFPPVNQRVQFPNADKISLYR